MKLILLFILCLVALQLVVSVEATQIPCDQLDLLELDQCKKQCGDVDCQEVPQAYESWEKQKICYRCTPQEPNPCPKVVTPDWYDKKKDPDNACNYNCHCDRITECLGYDKYRQWSCRAGLTSPLTYLTQKLRKFTHAYGTCDEYVVYYCPLGTVCDPTYDKNRSPCRPESCIDSDGGKEYSINGTVEDTGEKFYDFCKDELNLTEQFCQDGNHSGEDYDCSKEKKICDNGACAKCKKCSIDSLINNIRSFESKLKGVYQNFDAADLASILSYLRWGAFRRYHLGSFIILPTSTSVKNTVELAKLANDFGLFAPRQPIVDRSQDGNVPDGYKLTEEEIKLLQMETSKLGALKTPVEYCGFDMFHVFSALSGYKAGLSEELSPYYDHSISKLQLARFAEDDDKLNPGAIKNLLGNGHERAFWYTFGGDRIQELLNQKPQSPSQWRGNSLGMRVVNEYERTKGQLSDILEKVYNEQYCNMKEDGYKDVPEFKIMMENINLRTQPAGAVIVKGRKWLDSIVGVVGE